MRGNKVYSRLHFRLHTSASPSPEATWSFESTFAAKVLFGLDGPLGPVNGPYGVLRICINTWPRPEGTAYSPLALTDDLEVAAWPRRRNRAKVDAAVTNAVPRNALGSYHLACLHDDRAAGWFAALLANIGPPLLLPPPHFDVLSSRHLLFPSLSLSLEHSSPSKRKGFAPTLMPSSLPAASRLHSRCTPAVPETLHLASVNLLAWPAEYRWGGRLKNGLVVERCHISTGMGGDAAETPAIRSLPVGRTLKKVPPAAPVRLDRRAGMWATGARVGLSKKGLSGFTVSPRCSCSSPFRPSHAVVSSLSSFPFPSQ
ncbi:hypothetical protein B0T26DRAFT_119610 [Lasiosphaeria miniovina]|uniref:Uncharacterized protein n=1 Tax=Lasiosphaeria miniovina TaxID=1954250 RepID=A0AA40B470_9PEZI|nr:uncharacterized protein B0T26DRAFT_119610 [Lasiosphaeria miniovina]KAK0727172.1 hypothetical protein B0T26DRAFT_119610 [Lasiosphaeria miniovina]